MEPQSKTRDSGKLWLGVACAALAVLTILLSVQNLTLKSRLAAMVAAASELPPGALKAGETIPDFDVVDAAGARTRVAFDGSDATLLLVFSSTCGACRQTVPIWNRLLAETPSSRVHVVGIQTDFGGPSGSDASAVLAVPDLRFPVFGSAEPHGEPMSKIPVIPAAALVDPKGTVKGVWFGLPTDSVVSELRRALVG